MLVYSFKGVDVYINRIEYRSRFVLLLWLIDFVKRMKMI